jgi:hypothetical protein
MTSLLRCHTCTQQTGPTDSNSVCLGSDASRARRRVGVLWGFGRNSGCRASEDHHSSVCDSCCELLLSQNGQPHRRRSTGLRRGLEWPGGTPGRGNLAACHSPPNQAAFSFAGSNRRSCHATMIPPASPRSQAAIASPNARSRHGFEPETFCSTTSAASGTPSLFASR